MPTIDHIVYIPVLLMIGIVLGYVLANQGAKERMLVKEAQRKRRAEANKQSFPTEILERKKEDCE